MYVVFSRERSLRYQKLTIMMKMMGENMTTREERILNQKAVMSFHLIVPLRYILCSMQPFYNVQCVHVSCSCAEYCYDNLSAFLKSNVFLISLGKTLCLHYCTSNNYELCFDHLSFGQ